MVLARADGEGRLTFVDRHKEYVRLAGGLDADNHLSSEAIQRALACLSRFGDRLNELGPSQVRIVGTNTLRKARNSVEFLEPAESVLGHRIDIISGLEEARLVYKGVCCDFDRSGSRLVVDIGGGSTELILGSGREPSTLDSLYMGCVSWTQRFFPDGLITKKAQHQAFMAARRELGSSMRRYRGQFQFAVGSSGTINAIERCLIQSGMSPDGITPEALKALEARLRDFGRNESIKLPGISPERSQVLPGGLAVLKAVVHTLQVEQMIASTTALREGILVDLIGRTQTGDVRSRTVSRLVDRFQVDTHHASRVRDTALMLYDQVADEWDLHDPELRLLLEWAAEVHEIGLFMGYSGHHKHGSYVLAHADLAGFSRQEQRALAALVLGHRGRFSADRLEQLRPRRHIPYRLISILRVAVRLHRRRSSKPLPPIQTAVDGQILRLTFPEGWLAERPLTATDLELEKERCKAVGLELEFQ
jgi:exopolyphosphatase/guanosine-5'-triphosphate,3'-diphosphate pyrophosphatase